MQCPQLFGGIHKGILKTSLWTCRQCLRPEKFISSVLRWEGRIQVNCCWQFCFLFSSAFFVACCWSIFPCCTLRRAYFNIVFEWTMSDSNVPFSNFDSWRKAVLFHNLILVSEKVYQYKFKSAALMKIAWPRCVYLLVMIHLACLFISLHIHLHAYSLVFCPLSTFW